MPLSGVQERAIAADFYSVASHLRRVLIGGLLPRLRDERGMALVMTLGVLMVLTVVMTSVTSFTSANARTADRGNATQQASALADAGLTNAVSVLQANYPGSVAYPGNPALLPSRTTTYDYGSTTWSGTLVGPLTGAWRYEWRITSTGTIRNPTGPTSAVTRKATAIVPVVMPTATLTTQSSVLNWIYSGTDTHFVNSVQLGSPIYATRDLWLSNTSKVQGAAHKLVVGRNLYLTGPQNRVGLVSGLSPADGRIDEAHIIGQCSSQAIPALHNCLWDPDAVFATVHDNVIPATLIATPELTCCAPYAGAIAPAGTKNPSTMGFWYQYADLGPGSPCDPATKTGTPPTFESLGNNAIDNSATPATAFNLTPDGVSYTCKSVPGTPSNGELSWNASTRVLKVKGTIFIDGSATAFTGSGVPTYDGQATLMLSGTFMMKNSKLCAVVSSGDCNVGSGAWNPNTKALVVVADGDGVNGGSQSQGGEVAAGEGIHLKGSSFQGALIANKSVTEETSCAVQGPMISVYNEVWAGQSCAMTFPAISFAPSGGVSVASGAPSAELGTPQGFGG